MAPAAAGDKAKEQQQQQAGAASKWSMFKPSTWGQGKKKIKVAHLPEESNMYYHQELKRWVEKGKEHEAANDPGNAPPPTTAAILSSNRSPSQGDLTPPSGPSGTRRKISSRYVLQNNLSVSSSTSDLVDTGRSASMPPNGTGPSPRGSQAGGAAPPPPAAKFFIPAPPASSDSNSGAPADGATAAPTPAGAGGFQFFVPTGGDAAEQPDAQQQQQAAPVWAGYSSSTTAKGARNKHSSAGASTADSNGTTPPYASSSDLPAAAAMSNGWAHGLSSGYGPAETNGDTSVPEPASNGGEAHAHAAGEDAQAASGDGAGWPSVPQHLPGAWPQDQTEPTPSNASPFAPLPGGSAAGGHAEQGSTLAPEHPHSHSQFDSYPNGHGGEPYGGYAAAGDANGYAAAYTSTSHQAPYLGTEQYSDGQSSLRGWTAAQESGEAGHHYATTAACTSFGSDQGAVTAALAGMAASGGMVGSGAEPLVPNFAGAAGATGVAGVAEVTEVTHANGLVAAAAVQVQHMQHAVPAANGTVAEVSTTVVVAASTTTTAITATTTTATSVMAAGGAAPTTALQGAAKGLHSKGKQLLGALAGYVAQRVGPAAGGDGFGADEDPFGFEAAMHPGQDGKLDGPLPWELPEHLRYSDEFLSFCTAWQRNNPGKTYRPELLLPVEQVDASADDVLAVQETEGLQAVADVAAGVAVHSAAVQAPELAPAAWGVAETVVDTRSAADGDAWRAGYLLRKQQQQQQEALVAPVDDPPLPGEGAGVGLAVGEGAGVRLAVGEGAGVGLAVGEGAGVGLAVATPAQAADADAGTPYLPPPPLAVAMAVPNGWEGVEGVEGVGGVKGVAAQEPVPVPGVNPEGAACMLLGEGDGSAWNGWAMDGAEGGELPGARADEGQHQGEASADGWAGQQVLLEGQQSWFGDQQEQQQHGWQQEASGGYALGCEGQQGVVNGREQQHAAPGVANGFAHEAGQGASVGQGVGQGYEQLGAVWDRAGSLGLELGAEVDPEGAAGAASGGYSSADAAGDGWGLEGGDQLVGEQGLLSSAFGGPRGMDVAGGEDARQASSFAAESAAGTAGEEAQGAAEGQGWDLGAGDAEGECQGWDLGVSVGHGVQAWEAAEGVQVPYQAPTQELASQPVVLPGVEEGWSDVPPEGQDAAEVARAAVVAEVEGQRQATQPVLGAWEEPEAAAVAPEWDGAAALGLGPGAEAGPGLGFAAAATDADAEAFFEHVGEGVAECCAPMDAAARGGAASAVPGGEGLVVSGVSEHHEVDQVVMELVSSLEPSAGGDGWEQEDDGEEGAEGQRAEGQAAAASAAGGRGAAAEQLLQLLQRVQVAVTAPALADDLQAAASLLAEALSQATLTGARDAGAEAGARDVSQGRDTPTKPVVDTAALMTPQRLPAASPFIAEPSPSPGAGDGAAGGVEGGAGRGGHTPTYEATRPAGEDEDGAYAEVLAAARAELQADFDAKLAAQTSELEAHFDARLATARSELQQHYEQQLAERDAEIEAQKQRCDELQDDLDQLLLCLGQESRKVADLSDAMRQAGLDPDAIIVPIEEEYAMMDALPADGEGGEEA